MYIVCSYLDLHFMSGQNGMENVTKYRRSSHYLTRGTTGLSVAFFFGKSNILQSYNCLLFTLEFSITAIQSEVSAELAAQGQSFQSMLAKV